MNDLQAYIERTQRINPHYQFLELSVEDESLKAIKPGQYVLARLIEDTSEDAVENWHPYLREQWWPSGYTRQNTLLIEMPHNDRYRPGQLVHLLGAVGRPYQFRKSLRNVLLVAYDANPIPLIVMLGYLIPNRISVTLVLLGRARRYQTQHLSKEVEVIHGGDDFQWPEQVMTFGWADQIFVVSAQDDELSHMSEVLQAVEERRVQVPPNYVFGVFQPIQPCGVGACSACMLRVNKALHPVCTNGPAFDLTKVALPR